MNTRIKKLRKALDLTQQAFALRIGTSANVLTNYETGRRNPSSSVINNICKEFRVNEDWLRTGAGEMFREISRDDEITAFVNDVLSGESEDFKRRFIAALSRLSAEGWAALEQLVEDTALRKDAETPVPPGYSSRAELEAEADEFAAMAREQFLSEKIPGYQAPSASGSDDSGGVA
ncbi:MAG: helix-turn-helix transcriptional regulator [Oscillibacter sp.]|nr:helix-turn-helix transcriptional regulator [Oscillibacter sp.]